MNKDNTSVVERSFDGPQGTHNVAAALIFVVTNSADSDLGFLSELVLGPIQEGSRRPNLRGTDKWRWRFQHNASISAWIK